MDTTSSAWPLAGLMLVLGGWCAIWLGLGVIDRDRRDGRSAWRGVLVILAGAILAGVGAAL